MICLHEWDGGANADEAAGSTDVMPKSDQTQAIEGADVSTYRRAVER